VARRHSQYNVTTAAIDNLQFKAGAHLNDTLVLIGRITYVGNTSMEVRIDTYVESMDGMRKPINRAYFVMVAIDENEKPVRVPRLIVETESQRAEWEGGEKRTKLRKLRRKEGF
jgi:acyl-CoA hydrolase